MCGDTIILNINLLKKGVKNKVKNIINIREVNDFKLVKYSKFS